MTYLSERNYWLFSYPRLKKWQQCSICCFQILSYHGKFSVLIEIMLNWGPFCYYYRLTRGLKLEKSILWDVTFSDTIGNKWQTHRLTDIQKHRQNIVMSWTETTQPDNMVKNLLSLDHSMVQHIPVSYSSYTWPITHNCRLLGWFASWWSRIGRGRRALLNGRLYSNKVYYCTLLRTTVLYYPLLNCTMHYWTVLCSAEAVHHKGPYQAWDFQ